MYLKWFVCTSTVSVHVFDLCYNTSPAPHPSLPPSPPAPSWAYVCRSPCLESSGDPTCEGFASCTRVLCSLLLRYWFDVLTCVCKVSDTPDVGALV